MVGPSGAGKDSLIQGARQRLAGDPNYLFPQRVVSRPVDPKRERHESVTQAEFDAMQAGGAFCLVWKAHGLSYGVPASLAGALAQGRSVIVNASRSVVEEASARFPNVEVVQVTVSPATRALRLALRKSEGEQDQRDRLARSVTWSHERAGVREVNNDGSLEDGIAAFLQAVVR